MSFIIYKASAGSGKTFNLAKEYLKIVLQNPDDFKHILAITFTNKAANEMKTRIISYLVGISSDSINGKGKADLMPILMNELSFNENEIKLKAGIVLRKILYNYADFSIMTIDSFFQKIIRSFSHDLHIPMNFRLEINLKDIIEQIVDNLIDQVGENKEVGEILIQFINKLTNENKSWHIEKTLSDFSKEIFSESAYFNLRNLNNFDISDFILSINNLKLGLKQIEKEIKDQAQLAIQLIDSKEIALDSFSYKTKGVGFWFQKMSKGHFGSNSYVHKALREDAWFSKNLNPPGFDLIKPQIIEITTILFSKMRDLFDLKKIYNGIYTLALVNQIKNVIQEIKDDEGLFFLSETNFILSEVIQNQPTPFIYERIGERYHHYFMDEFQDTSKLQWQNMIPLILEAISSLHNEKSGSAIIFGDAKQSIYRFRGGDFMQFVQLPKIDTSNNFQKSTQKIFDEVSKQIPLETNFRTKAQIVNFNNEIFEIIKNFIPNHAHLYHQHHQFFVGKSSEGLVDINFFDKQNNNELYIDEMHGRVLQIIHELTNEGYQLKDIAILGRDKKHLSHLASFLILNDIRIISSDSLFLDASEDVRFLKNMIHFIKSENDEIVNASIIRYLIAKKPDLSFEQHLKFSKTREMMLHYFHLLNYHFNDNLCSKHNIYDLMEELIRVFIAEKTIDSYISGFIDIVHKYHIEQKSESDFSNWWNEQNENFSIAMPEGIDGVKLLTIHTAKGLEYPVVILPTYTNTNKSSSIWVSTNTEDSTLPYYNLPAARIQLNSSDTKETGVDELKSHFFDPIFEEQQLKLIDEINISYVALTRPIDRLYILCQKPSESSLKNDNYSFSKLLQIYLNTHPDISQDSTFTEFSHYIIGQSTPKAILNQTEKSEKMIPINCFSSVAWHHSKNIEYSTNNSEAIEWGTIFHYSMQYIYGINDIESAIKKTNLRFSLNLDQKTKLQKLILNTCNHPLISKYFNNEFTVYNEKSIVDSEGNLHRPDRIITHHNSATIIDFKTGTVKENHNEQINKYKQLIKDVGFENISAFVVYVQTEEVNIVEF